MRKKQISKFKKILSTLLISVMIFITGCTSNTSTQTINGIDLQNGSELFDENNILNVISTQKEKYERHYKNNLYYEQYPKAQEELNKLYNEKLRKEIDEYIKTQVPQFKDCPYILKTQIEYVKQDLKYYEKGIIAPVLIVDNPDRIMSVKIQWYIFEDFMPVGIYVDEAEVLLRKITKEFLEKVIKRYIDNGVEDFRLNVRAYKKDTLDKYSIQEIEKQENIELFLQEEGKKSSFKGNIYKTYFGDRTELLIDYINFLDLNLKQEEGKKVLKEKYNLEFDEAEGWYIPKNNPELFFRSHYDDGYSNHIQETIYQYLANKEVEKQIKEAGLSDNVVFLVTAESDLFRSYDSSSTIAPYNFGEGFDGKDFLKYGYTGKVYITLIYLSEEPFDKLKDDFDVKIKYFNEVKEELMNKVVEPLNEVFDFESSPSKGYKTAYIYLYHVNEYDKKIIIDLFKKHPITEREDDPELELYNVFSLIYKTRAETPGFHYIDIFAELNSDSELKGYLREYYKKIKEKESNNIN